ncbi:hypothetical protein G6Z17_08485 [Clostridium perfringens]|uniref:hypothetical protein n=1 Tax=Clostridium perfringens TaxID=1502 RepID=UPI0013E2E1CB|nr:hypothetical protein [Clostridium perfringens]NGT49048.1 hypothetical protein [Clostridium perfringens]
MTKKYLLLRGTSYISSIFPFSIYMFLVYKDDNYKFYDVNFLTPKFAVWILLVMQVASWLYLFYFYKVRIKQKKNMNVFIAEFSEVRIERSNTSNYILANVLPIATIDLDSEMKSLFVIGILILLGIMYIKNNLYYINPIYDILGIKVYNGIAHLNVKGNGKYIDRGIREVVIISKKNLYANNNSEYELIEGFDDVMFCWRK